MLVSLLKSYFYLLRASKELNSILSGATVEECYTQERDKLFLHIPIDQDENFHFIISTNPQEYSLQLKENHHKAKKNTISFFSEYFPQKILSVSIAKGDRIIRLSFAKGSLIILFRGGKSNCFYENEDGELFPFKKVDEQIQLAISSELKEVEWLDNENQLIEQINLLTDLSEIKSFQFLSKDLIRLASNNEVISKENLTRIIHSIISEQIAVGTDKEHSVSFFQPLSTISPEQKVELELFESYFEAQSVFLSQNIISNKELDVRREIEKQLASELERVTGKLNNLKARIENGSREHEYKLYGELLLNNLKQINKGMKEILLYNWSTDLEVKIKLDPKLSPQQNIDFYFEKSRAEKTDFEKSEEFCEEAQARYSKLQIVKDRLEQELTIEELFALKKELRLKPKQTLTLEERKDKPPYRHYVIDGKYNFYIGKDSRNNDQLTTKFAKQNDFWFHARSVAGSHGVLRVENTKEAIPKRVLEKAASITAFYSKAKTSKLAPVTYTLKKYVSKNSRHEPGQVSVMKESVLLVKPEIPFDCEFQID